MKFLFWFTQILALVAELVVACAIFGQNTSFAEFHGSAVLIFLALETFVFVLYYLDPSDKKTRKFLLTSILCSISLGLLATFLVTFWLGNFAYYPGIVLRWFTGITTFALPVVSSSIKVIEWYGDLFK